MSFLWNGLTAAGNVVPIQVDAQGRVVAVDSSPQPPTNTVGLSSWASWDPTLGLQSGFNVQGINNTATGKYEITFSTPLLITTYSVVATTGLTTHKASFFNRTTTGFDIYTVNINNGFNENVAFNFMVCALVS